MAVTIDTPVRLFSELTIDGASVQGEGRPFAVYNPATGEVLGEIASATLEQTEQAIAAARRAFLEGPWPRMAPAERAAAISRVLDLVADHRDELIATIVREVGTPVSTAEGFQFDVPMRVFRGFVDAAAVDRTEQIGPDFYLVPSASLVGYRPVGVVGGIAAYNYPLHLAGIKIFATMAAGCPIVLTPSPRAPFSTLLLGRLITEAGIPPGVVNIVVSDDMAVSQMIASHRDIDKVTFTGSDAVGEKIMRQASDSLKGVALELGGKSANILMPGTNLESLLPAVHMRYSRNAGQGCASPTRILVHSSQADEFVERSVATWPQITVGDPWDRSTVCGPLIRPEHLARVQGYVEMAVADGGSIVAGGGRPDFDRGWWYNPTLIGSTDNHSRIAREEVFGPVAVMLTYDTVEDAIRIANDSDYGLAGYLFGSDLEQCIAVAGRLQAGTVQINGGGALRPDAPYGGFKRSGLGREFGEWGVREFLEPQHVQWALTTP
jgi:aldehyde dehydrogenase (NAD+)